MRIDKTEQHFKKYSCSRGLIKQCQGIVMSYWIKRPFFVKFKNKRKIYKVCLKELATLFYILPGCKHTPLVLTIYTILKLCTNKIVPNLFLILIKRWGCSDLDYQGHTTLGIFCPVLDYRILADVDKIHMVEEGLCHIRTDWWDKCHLT